MALTSFAFIIFLLSALIAFIGLMVIAPRTKPWLIVLLNVIFYSSFGWNGVAIWTGLTVVGYIATLMLHRSHNTRLRRAWLGVSLITPIAILLFYKFFQPTLQLAITQQWVGADISLQFLLPVGLSFYSFRLIAHAVEMYKGNIQVPNLIDYAAYIGFFPHIIAGPIARPHQFYTDLHATQYNPQIRTAVLLFLSGFFKKLVLSSFLYTYTSAVFQVPEQFTSIDAVFGLFVFSAYIFTDFSGYTDIANATALLFGFQPVANFAGPYGAKSIAEFWGRWHISLSSWFGSYLYIPLGGDGRNAHQKNGVWIRNVLTVMLVSGVWHGVGWGFVVWGAMHGVAIVSGTVLKRLFGATIQSIHPLHMMVNWLCILATYTLVSITWIFFAVDDSDGVITFFEHIISMTTDVPVRLITNWVLVAIVAGVFVYNIFHRVISDSLRWLFMYSPLLIQAAVVILCLVAISFLKPEIVPPYVYQSF